MTAKTIKKTTTKPAPKGPVKRAHALDGWLALCVPLVKASEDCKLDAYPDPASGGDPWTIGWGCTGTDRDGHAIAEGVSWTQDKADAELLARLDDLGRVVDKLVTVAIVDQMKAALVDFCYNLGTTNFERSTLRRLLNVGSYNGAAMQFGRWIHAGGRVMPGLQTRRARERDLFLTGTWK